MERCPACNRMSASKSHYDGLLSCSYITCGYDERDLGKDELELLKECLAEEVKKERLKRIGKGRAKEIRQYAIDRRGDLFKWGRKYYDDIKEVYEFGGIRA